MTDSNDDLDQRLTTRTAARLLGLTATRLRQLANSGAFRRQPNGTFKLRELIEDRTKQLKEQIANARKETPLTAADTRLKLALAASRELELRRQRGQVVEPGSVGVVVEKLMVDLVRAVRSRAARLTPDLAMQPAPVVRAVLDADSRAMHHSIYETVGGQAAYVAAKAAGKTETEARAAERAEVKRLQEERR